MTKDYNKWILVVSVQVRTSKGLDGSVVECTELYWRYSALEFQKVLQQFTWIPGVEMRSGKYIGCESVIFEVAASRIGVFLNLTSYSKLYSKQYDKGSNRENLLYINMKHF